MRYFVTGATGFVGANLVRHLLTVGHAVVCVVRKPNRCVDGLPIELVRGDLSDEAAMARAMEGCDGVFHVAGTFDPGPDGERLMTALHVDATRALLGAARRAGVPRFVTCSSSVTVGFGPMHAPGDESTPLDPGPIYGHAGALRTYHDSKLASEAMTVAAGGVVVNPDYVLGAWDVKPTSGQLLLTIGKSRWVPLHPRGGKCFIDADDCAVGHLAAMERGAPGRRYLLGNHNVSYRDFMGACAEVTGRPKPRVAVPNVALRAAGAVGRALSRVDVHRFAGLEPHLLLAMQQERYRSGRRSWDELGVPRTELRVTIEKAWRWFVDHGYTA